MSQSARQRPRPRPVASKPTHIASAGDEDDLFRRNRGRTAQHWRQLGQSAAKAVPFTSTDDDWDVDNPGDDSRPKPRRKKLPKQNVRPRWQGTNVAKLLSSDNEDDDLQIIQHTVSNPLANSPRKRGRSRSQSITPPPELPPHQRTNAMNLVRQALAIQQRPPSPASFLDDSSDTIDLDPELAKIADAARQQVKHAHMETERMGGPQSVNVNVRWRPHPLNPLAQEQYWTFNMRRHDTFRELFDEVADLAGIMPDQLMVSHDQRHVFASGTPHSLHIWAEGDMEACDRHTAEYIRAQRENRDPPSSPADNNTSAHSPLTIPHSVVESEAESIEEDTIKLVVRSAATKERTFPLTVRSTTTCGAVVQAFFKAADLSDTYYGVGTGRKSALFPHLMIDGDKMDPNAEIGDADLEDGDLVEIVGI